MVVDSPGKIPFTGNSGWLSKKRGYAGTILLMSAPEEIVDALLDAFESREFERARDLLADDGFSYDSPIESFGNADDFILAISRVGPIMKHIERCDAFVKDNGVCKVIKVHTTMDILKAAPVVLLATVADGRITSLETIFDATEYNKMLVTGE